eukprot:jgi/Mesen1/8073/ME000433S07368
MAEAHPRLSVKDEKGEFWSDGTGRQRRGGFDDSSEGKIVVCADISGGREPMPIPCVVDSSILHELSERQVASPESLFQYVTKRQLSASLGLTTAAFQVGCQCRGPRCEPEACDHVLMFAEDNADACDISGAALAARFPYDAHGRIIIPEHYMAYECNSQCACSAACPNRVLQRGVRVRLEVFCTRYKL